MLRLLNYVNIMLYLNRYIMIFISQYKEDDCFMPKVIALCMPCTDHLLHVDKLPRSNGGARILDESWQGGGNSATAIVAVGAQGVSAGIICAVGDDDYGVAQIVDFKRFNVDTSHIQVRKDTETPVNLCISDEETNGRSFLGKWRRSSPIAVEDLDMDYLLTADYLLIDSNTPATQKAAKAILDKGGDVIFDASMYSETQEAMLPFTSVYITSEFYYKTRYGEDKNIFDCCRDMMAKGPHTVIFTLGEKGCYVAGEEKEGFHAAIPVRVTDTTGGADAFISALAVYLNEKCPFEEALDYALKAAAFCVSRQGTLPAMVDRTTLESYIVNIYENR